jgi:BA14K-like protein
MASRPALPLAFCPGAHSARMDVETRSPLLVERRIMMRSVPCILAAAFAGFAFTAAPADAQVGRGPVATGVSEAVETPLIEKTQYHRGGRYHGGGHYRHGGYRGYRGGGYYNNGGNVAGAAIAGGILGLATGAIIAGSAANAAQAAPPPAGAADPNWVAYCARKYKSFDPSSGTYLSTDGNRYYCK